MCREANQKLFPHLYTKLPVVSNNAYHQNVCHAESGLNFEQFHG